MEVLEMKKIIPVLVLVVLIAVIVMALYMLRSPDKTKDIGESRVSVRMKWFLAGTMACWFGGQETGFYRDQGIDIEINPGGPDNSAVKLVAAGTDLFGVAGADEILMAREKGVPVVAIAVLFKESPIGFVSKQSSGIKSPDQWQDKTVEVSYGSNAEVQYRALLKKFNVKEVKEVPYTYNLAPFMEDKVDVTVVYLMDQAITLQQKGVGLNIIQAKEYGINPYGDVIITSEKTLKDRPELVRRFLVATRKSIEWSIRHPSQAVDSLVKKAPNLKLENETLVWKATTPFIIPDGNVETIGQMEGQRWQETYDVLKEFDFVKQPLDLNAAYVNVLQE
jgi:ABC-type nitrate/sulfonate/bicarbonate transport system substrate-binding protein